jgi:hypothetical protein
VAEGKLPTETILVMHLPDDVYFDSGNNKEVEVGSRASATSAAFIWEFGRSALVTRVNALVKECRKASEPDQYQSEINKPKLDMHVGRSYDEN